MSLRGVPTEVHFVGDGPSARTVAETAKKLGVHVEILGWHEEWTSNASGFDCLVLPSEQEGFGNVLVEAAAIGLPVVAPSPSLGAADAVVPGVTGTLALSNSASDLADSAMELLEPRREWSAPAAWLRRHEPPVVARSLEIVVERALALHG
jgi:glycosyltransferase involved in cell wall biosynthesis